MNVPVVEDDLTNLSRNALKKVNKTEGLGLDDEVFVKDTPDEIRAKLREARKAKGVAPPTLDPEPAEASMEPWKLELPVLPIRQLGRDAFVTSIKYRDLDKIVVDADVQRPESKKRVSKIAEYVKENDGYFGAAVLTVIGGDVGSVVLDENRLIVDHTCRIVVNDGQHRIAGIKRAIADGLIEEDRMDDDLPVLIYVNLEQDEQRQLFADINLNAMKPPKAIGLNFNDRNLLVRFAKALIERSTFKGRVNYLKTKITAKDRETFTFASIVSACDRMFDDLSPETFDAHLADAVEFWNQVDDAIGPVWDAKDTIANTTVGLSALAGLYGEDVDWSKLAALRWNEGGELHAAVADAGGSNAAVKRLFDYLAVRVVSDGAESEG